MMALKPHHNINRNMAQVRMMYFQEILKITEATPKKFWESTCKEFLEDNNTLLKKKHLDAFSYRGEYFPESVRSLRKSQLMRVSAPLHESLEEEFEEIREECVNQWNIVRRDFKNMLNKALALAKNEIELSLVVPRFILDRIEHTDFLANPNATGLTADKAEALLKQYPSTSKISKLETIGKLL